MIHRHLDIPVDLAISEVGDAALDDLLDRGELADWQRLLRAIAADPLGDLATRVLRLSQANPRYGTSALWQAWILHRRQTAPSIPRSSTAP
jgi:hypothetical protein